MAKLVKWLFIVVGILALLFALAVFFIASNLGSIIKQGVNDYSKDVVGVSMTVSNVDVNLLAGQASLSDFVIANPTGFSNNNSFELKNVALVLDLKSLQDEVIVIEKIVIGGASILAEQIDTRINLKVLKDELSHHTASTSSSNKEVKVSEAGESSELPKIAISYFEFSDAGAKVVSSHFSDQQVNIPTITLNNIGSKTQGLTLNNAANAILQPLMARILEEVQQQALKGSVDKLIKKELEKNDVSGKLKGLLNKL